MYETHFGLRQRPFPAIADSSYYYPATSHEQALSQLQQVIQDDESFALLTGGPGTGKTLLCHCLLDRLGDTVTGAFLTHSHFPNRAGLLQLLLYDISLPHEGRTEQELRLSFTDFLLKNYERGRRTVLVLDEAQYLSSDLLEELRLLGNLEGRGGRAFQTVLAAQPAFLNQLLRPELAVLRQRLAVRAHLDPLGLHEAADYVVHHLRAAGGRPERIVSDEALEIMANGTHGVPRLLNRAMHRALTLAFQAEATLVDAEAAMDALSILGLVDELENPDAVSGLTAPSEPVAEERDASETEDCPEVLLTLDETTERGQERTALSIPDSVGPRRPPVSPRRPA
jgi:type II secretory pathway predicted ATPase ExeA